MRKIIKPLSALFPLFITLSTLASNDTDSTILATMITELETAVTTGDKSIWMKYMNVDGVMINRDGKLYSREELVSELHPPSTGREFSIDVKDLKIYINGNSAFATFIADEHLKIFGQIMDTKFRTTNYFEKINKVWKLKVFEYYEIPIDPAVCVVYAELLKQYEGTYQLSENSYIKIYLDNNKLMSHKNGGIPRQMFPIDKNGRFFFKDEEGERFFLLNKDGAYDLIQRRNYKDLIWRNTKTKLNE
ncbi:MAG: nuclear transport factor 2 family protein [Bacteroidetes bacterium]|nr:nuclear transport factor 2 family protein [Bacteroidota bacterium]